MVGGCVTVGRALNPSEYGRIARTVEDSNRVLVAPRVVCWFTERMRKAEHNWSRLVARRATAIVVVVGLALTAACGPQISEDTTPETDNRLVLDTYTNVDQADGPPTTGGHLRYGLPFETNSWHPGLAQWGAHSMQVARAIFDPLFEYDADGTVHPFLLERAEPNSDFTEWTLVLRKGIRFHDGRAMTAKDMSLVAQHLITSTVVGSAWAINSLSGSTIVDDQTLVITSTKPWVTLPHQSASQLGFVPDPDWMDSDDWGRPIGSGPFMVNHWNVGRDIVLHRNPNYWRHDAQGNQLPYLDRVEFVIVTDDNQRYRMLRDGQLDVMMQTAPGATAAEVVRDARAGQVQLIADNQGETAEDFVLLNTARPALADVDARRALAAAIDREEAARVLTDGLSPPAAGMFEPDSPWYVPSTYPAYEPDRAAALARRAESRTGEPFTFVLKGPATPEGLRAMQFVQASWAKVGIEVQIEAVMLSKMLITMVMGDFDALLMQHFDYPHPAPELVFVNPAQVKPLGEPTLSFSRITDPGISQAIDGALHSLDPEIRRESIALLQARLDELIPYIWLVHARRYIVARPGVVNLVNHRLPDGAPGLDFLLGSHRIDQTWLRR
jgi:peptide/nickel transport system substrate-binding protein